MPFLQQHFLVDRNVCPLVGSYTPNFRPSQTFCRVEVLKLLGLALVVAPGIQSSCFPRGAALSQVAVGPTLPANSFRCQLSSILEVLDLGFGDYRGVVCSLGDFQPPLEVGLELILLVPGSGVWAWSVGGNICPDFLEERFNAIGVFKHRCIGLTLVCFHASVVYHGPFPSVGDVVCHLKSFGHV